MVAMDKIVIVKSCDRFLHLLHKTRSTPQFTHLASLVIYQLRGKLKEEGLANLIEKEYTAPPYACWNVTASNVIFCDPSSQPIEA